MNKTMKSWLLAVVLPLFLTACVSLPINYSADSITATVVDAESGAPLEGVIVVAHWQLEHGTFGGNVPTGQLMVMEAVTNKEGVFHFPAWGPKTVWGDFLIHWDPRILLFKPGYEFRELTNTWTPYEGQRTKSQRISEWNKRTIALRLFRGDEQKYAEHVYDLGVRLERILDLSRGSKTCNWRKVPNMLSAIDEIARLTERKKIQLPGWRLGQHILRIRDIQTGKNCGDPEVGLIGDSK